MEKIIAFPSIPIIWQHEHTVLKTTDLLYSAVNSHFIFPSAFVHRRKYAGQVRMTSCVLDNPLALGTIFKQAQESCISYYISYTLAKEINSRLPAQ